MNFSEGLCGIGWGLEYLFQHGFTEGYLDEILEDIDAKIMGRDIRRISDMSFDFGFEGILSYVVTRVESCKRQSKIPFFDCSYLHEFWKKVDENSQTISVTMVERLNKIVAGQSDFTHKPLLTGILSVHADVLTNHFQTMPIGIKGGLTGIVLKMMI